MSIPPPPLPPTTDLLLPPPPTAAVPAIPRNPFTPTVLLTHAPPFLHTFRAVRDWLFPCGNVRHCTFFPRKKDDDDDDTNASLDKDSRITILITMSHPDGACQFLAAFKAFSSRLDDRYNTMQAYMVPANKDVPLPPPILDSETQERLGGQLWDNFVRAEAPELQEGGGATGGDGSGASNNNADAATATGTSTPAATTGMGDEDEDPLSNPAVIAAVKDFRRKLSKTHSYQNKKRMDLVAQKMAEIKPKVAAQMEQEKQMAAAAAAAPPPPLPPGGALPPPPPPMGSMPPPPEGLPPPPVAAAGDSGKRGLSNLPAWMTNQPEAGAATAAAPSDEPPTKRIKQEPPPSPANANANTASFPPTFPPLPPSSHDPLRTFLANKVQEHLGEQEATLIQFLHSHILAQKSTDELLQELQMVLDDEAPVFLQEIWGKVHELVVLK